MCDGSPVISNAQTSPSKQPVAKGVLARHGMARSCTQRMADAGFWLCVAALASMGGDSRRRLTQSGAAMGFSPLPEQKIGLVVLHMGPN